MEMKNMIKIVRIIETFIFAILIIFLSASLLISIVDFAVFFFKLFLQRSLSNWYEPEFLIHLFSSFLIVLVGVELLETIKAYLKDDAIRIELIILAALIALARKIIVINYTDTSSDKLIGMASIIFSLGLAYFLIKKAGITINLKEKDNQQSTKN